MAAIDNVVRKLAKELDPRKDFERVNAVIDWCSRGKDIGDSFAVYAACAYTMAKGAIRGAALGAAVGTVDAAVSHVSGSEPGSITKQWVPLFVMVDLGQQIARPFYHCIKAVIPVYKEGFRDAFRHNSQ